MKSIALAIACLAATSGVLAQNVQVFDVDIHVHENCDLVVSYKDKQAERLQAPFSSTGKCRIMPNSETNIPRVEFVQGEYVLLVESMAFAAETCRAELAALIVNRDDSVRLSTKTHRTSACGIAERKDFEILRHHSRK